jgi:hypothetical protein
MNGLRDIKDIDAIEKELRRLFDASGASRFYGETAMDSAQQMKEFWDLVRSHPEKRNFVGTLIADSFLESVFKKFAPKIFTDGPRGVKDNNAIEGMLRHLFDMAAAMSEVCCDRLDAEPEMERFLQAVVSHPSQRAFVAGLFISSFEDGFYMKWPPKGLIMYCMSTLRWPEILDFARAQRTQHVEKTLAKNCIPSPTIWDQIIESFQEGWREKYFQDFTKLSKPKMTDCDSEPAQ